MNKDEMNLIREVLVFKAIPLSGDAFAEAIAILDAELAAPDPRIARTLSTQEIYKLWRERPTWNIPAFVRRCFKAAQS